LKEERLKELIWTETDTKIQWWITARIKEPENVKLLFAKFERLSTTDEKNNFTTALKPLVDIKSISDYQNNIPNKDVATVIADLNTSPAKLEALVTIPLDQEITLKDNKKYKIKKKSDWSYEAEEIPQ
jgi:hypothetical protein